MSCSWMGELMLQRRRLLTDSAVGMAAFLVTRSDADLFPFSWSFDHILWRFERVVKCWCWTVNQFMEGKVDTRASECHLWIVFLQEQMKLLNFEMHGALMKTRFHLTMDTISHPYDFTEYEFHHVCCFGSAWSPYKDFLTFAFKNLWWKDTRKVRAGSVLSSFTCVRWQSIHTDYLRTYSPSLAHFS